MLQWRVQSVEYGFWFQMLKDTKNVYVGMVECQEEARLCQQQNVQSYPNLRLFPPKSKGGSYL